jgi:hypothetical protein
LVRELFPRWQLGTSYLAFVQALGRVTPELLAAITQRLQRATQAWTRHWQLFGWVVMVVDGSRFECPRTRANEKGLGCAGREKTPPQVFQTTLQHVGTGLPWAFRLGPGTDSERRHLDDLRAGLPPGTLVVADAGFISYDLCQWLVTGRVAFLLRVGGNVQLLTELGYAYEVRGQTVYLWPEKRRDQPPLVLRLIVLTDGHQQPVYLVTNLLDEQVFSAATAAVIYRLRWGVEGYYRTLKQTLSHHRLLSGTPHTALVEQTWAVLGAWLLHLLTARELVAAQQSPRRWSPAKARDAVRRTMRQAMGQRCRRRDQPLRQRLRLAVLDAYQRRGPKQTREWPRKKKDQPPGPPKMRSATDQERQAAKRFWCTAPPRL